MLNGAKRFITNAPEASVFLVYAKIVGHDAGPVRTPLTERYFQDAGQAQRIRDLHAMARFLRKHPERLFALR